MFAVENTVEIAVPVSQAWSKISQLDRVDEWVESVKEAHFHTDLHEGVGTGRTCEIEGFGTLRETVVAWEQERGFTLDVQGMPALVKTAHGSWLLEPAGEGKTRATMKMEVSTRFGVLGRLAERWMLKPQFAATVQGATEQFKRTLENPPATQA
jgi:coenzyme Q-binding protein COQ10